MTTKRKTRPQDVKLDWGVIRAVAAGIDPPLDTLERRSRGKNEKLIGRPVDIAQLRAENV
jgi:hypothetical protein